MTADQLDPSASGDDAEAARLQERLHRGELPRERLTLADYLGHRPSRLALGRGGPEPAGAEAEPDATLEFWGRRLARWGPPVMLRAGVALARHLAVVTAPPEPAGSALTQGLGVADRFLGRPHTGDEDEPLVDAADRAATELARATLTLDPDAPARRACQTLLPTLRAVLGFLQGGTPDKRELDQHYLRTLEQAEAAGVDPEVLESAVRDEVVPWALAPSEGEEG